MRPLRREGAASRDAGAVPPAAPGTALEALLQGVRVVVVVPAYKAEATIGTVLEEIPRWVARVVVVVDGSPDRTTAVVQEIAQRDRRIVTIVREVNGGVGAAVRDGYAHALLLGAEVVVKMDSDGQMDPAYLPNLVLPIALGQADYTKGNRFRRPDALAEMPAVRLIGNAVLSLLTKLSSGYWQLLDPTNGYTAISREALTTLDLRKLDARYFFESSMLIELGLARAVVADVAMPSRYRGEASHLSLGHSAFSFAYKHVRHVLRRLVYRYLLTDFSAVSLLLALSLPLVGIGVGFGLWSWMDSALRGVPATAGTVMLAAFPAAGGAYCLVQAMVYDIMSTPQRPLTLPRLGLLRPAELLGAAPRAEHHDTAGAPVS